MFTYYLLIRNDELLIEMSLGKYYGLFFILTQSGICDHAISRFKLSQLLNSFVMLTNYLLIGNDGLLIEMSLGKYYGIFQILTQSGICDHAISRFNLSQLLNSFVMLAIYLLIGNMDY